MTRASARYCLPGIKSGLFALALGGLVAGAGVSSVQAEVPAAFRQAVAETASASEAVARFYRENGYQAIWTGTDEESRLRRSALLAALSETSAHGLPDRSAQVNSLLQQMRDARTVREVGNVEAALSQALVDYATDLKTGFLEPSRIDDGMVRKKHTVYGASFLAGIRDGQPFAYLRSLVLLHLSTAVFCVKSSVWSRFLQQAAGGLL